jgi:hypothetical protein
VNLGDAFINAEVRNIPSHLWFVVSNPTGAARVVIVNVSSNDDGLGCLITLVPGEHPWLRHASFIRTDGAMLATVASLQAALAANPRVVFRQAPTPAPTLRKLQQALLDCQHTKLAIKAELTAQGLP